MPRQIGDEGSAILKEKLEIEILLNKIAQKF
jgi:hypothetical protein